MQSERDKKLVQDFLLKFENIKKFRQPYETQWKEVTKWVVPGKNFWEEIKDNSPEASSDIYDSTPISAVKILANGLQGFMAKRGKFFKLNMESSKALNRPIPGAVRGYLQVLEQIFNWIFARSNFYQSINETFAQGSTIGTVVIYPEEVTGEDKIIYSVIHPKEVWITENYYKIVDTTFWEKKLTARAIVKRFKDKLEEKFVKDAEKNPYKEFTVINGVFPREERDIEKIDKGNKEFASIWVLKEGGILLEESGFDSFPYIVWRWSTEHGGTYGRSPANDAMADILRGNNLKKTLLEASQEFVHPPLNVPQEKMGLLDISPRGMNPYDNSGRIITPIQTVGSYPVGIDREQDVDNTIKEHFFTNMFLMLNNSMDTERTATEVMELQAEKASVLGSITARIESELFDQIFDRTLAIAVKAGWVPPVPEEMKEFLVNDNIAVDYVGPMAQLQDRYYDMQMLDSEINRIVNLSQFFPGILDNVDQDALVDHLLNKSSLPQNLIRNKRQIAQMRAARAQQVQEQQGSENLQKQASALKDLGDTNQENVAQVMGG